MGKISRTKKNTNIRKALITGLVAGTSIVVPTITIAAGIGKIDPTQVDTSAPSLDALYVINNSSELDSFGLDLDINVSKKGQYTGTILSSTATWIIETYRLNDGSFVQTASGVGTPTTTTRTNTSTGTSSTWTAWYLPTDSSTEPIADWGWNAGSYQKYYPLITIDKGAAWTNTYNFTYCRAQGNHDAIYNITITSNRDIVNVQVIGSGPQSSLAKIQSYFKFYIDSANSKSYIYFYKDANYDHNLIVNSQSVRYIAYKANLSGMSDTSNWISTPIGSSNTTVYWNYLSAGTN